MTLSVKLKKYRSEKNLTQQQAAEKLFVSRQAISNWENGKNAPDLSTLILLSDVYEVSLDKLLKGETEVVKKIEKKMVLKYITWVSAFLLFLAMSICVTIDLSLNKVVSWSAIVVLCCFSALLILVSSYWSQNKFLGFFGSFSIILLPFLFILEKILNNLLFVPASLFVPVGLYLSFIWLAVCWIPILIYLVQKKKNKQPNYFYLTSILCLLAVVGMSVTNQFLHEYQSSSVFLLDNFINIGTLMFAAIALFSLGRNKKMTQVVTAKANK